VSPRLRMLVDDGRFRFRGFAIGLYTAAALVLAVCVWVGGWQFYRQGPIVVVVMLGGTGALYHAWYRSLRWDRNAVLIALCDTPGDIVGVEVDSPVGLTALLDERSVTIRTRERWIMLVIKVRDLPALGRALAEQCPGADLRGFGV
jgi:hypothetical protein